MTLCTRCLSRPPWSPRAKLCVECSNPNDIRQNLRARARTRARQLRGKPVRFDVQPLHRDQRLGRKHQAVTVPLPLLAIRGDAMTRAEVAAVLGMTEYGVNLLEARALERFERNWREMFGEQVQAAE